MTDSFGLPRVPLRLGAISVDRRLGPRRRARSECCELGNLPDDAVREDRTHACARASWLPGERIITRGERGDTVFFIASGAVEVDTGAALIRLGRGTCVGELAAFSGGVRSAHVTMLGYGELLVLHGRAFRRLLARNDGLRRQVEALVASRGGRREAREALLGGAAE